jgi:regulator of RNase E activity RraA
MTFSALPAELLAQLARIDSCSLSNAIEATGVRQRDEGFADATVRCRVHCAEPLLGYAFTLRVSTTHPKVAGVRYVDHVDWAEAFLALPQPRVLVVEDMHASPATGAFLGEVHASIYRALGCAGVVTNGAVRDLPRLQALGFSTFARYVSVSHAYAHVVEVAPEVCIGGMRVSTGDLLHGDRHGVLCVPAEVAHALPDIVAQQQTEERRILALCAAPQFSLAALRDLLAQIQAERPLPG